MTTGFDWHADWPQTRDAMRRIARQHMNTAATGVETKADGSWVTAVDHAVQAAARSWLAEHFPTIGFLGEEMTDEEQSAAWSRCLAGEQALWVVDPLDGTSNFRAGFPVFSLTLALLDRGQVIAGLVYDPVRDELFHARRGTGAFLNETRLDVSKLPELPLARCLAIVDFKRLDKTLACRLAGDAPYASQRSIGSVALDWCWLAAGRVQVYVHGKQKPWDYAAGQLIALEAGASSAALDGHRDALDDALKLAPRSAVVAVSESLMDEWLGVLLNA
ncbi:inositol monophosphatase family protein [Halothiobacillus sp.]|uniref:inositol monophosphatase family protein n=3 Tax=Halothiobacillus sp. TaxID=1891311 RepID=UPI002631E31F|nr:inositol monophosphatase family protein [Halothiobacillus sp.]MDD4965920.1 inositol monophosphatase family protein [Halothiobacillus sp.]